MSSPHMSHIMSRKKPGLPKKKAPEIDLALACVGIFTRVANEKGVSVSHVIKVAKNERTSQHISEALILEVRRILGRKAA